MTHADLLREHLLMECEGEISPIQREPQLPPDQVEVVERLTAADLIVKMRRVKQLAPKWSEITKAQYQVALEKLSLEAAAASAYLKRHRADDDFVPAFLRETGSI